MDDSPLVSIIIPAYNAEKYIRETLESALNQTYKNIEIIVIDDESKDRTFEIAKTYQDKGVNVFIQKNSGASVARNYGNTLSKGEFIQYLDSDDLISPNKIERQIALFREFGNEILVSCHWDRFTNDYRNECKFPKRFLDKDWDNPIEWLINSWNGKGMAQTSVWLFHRVLLEKAGKWNDQITVNDDGEFFCRMILKSSKIKFCNDAFVYYRSNVSNSLSQKSDSKAVKSILNSYILYKENILQIENSQRIKLAVKQNFLNFIYQYYNQYPEFINIAKQEIINLGLKVNGSVGGFKMRILTSVFGFENAIRLKNKLGNF